MSKEDKGKVKMTVIHFETESDNETLKENIRSISLTLAKALSSNNRTIVQQPQLNGAERETEEEVAEVIDDPELEFSSNGNKIKKKSSPGKVRIPKLLDLNFKGKKDLTLKSFVEGKTFDSNQKKYLAIAYWLKNYGGTEELNGDMAYTCLKHLDWTVPKDVWKPFRNMMDTRFSWFAKGSTPGNFKLTHVGESEVEKIIGNNK